MRILVCGGRDFGDYKAVLRNLQDTLLGVNSYEITVVHGAARGADSLAGRAAREMGWTEEQHPALWDKYGKKAGFLRNQEMLDSGIDYALVFPGGTGTYDMMVRLYRDGIPFKYIGKKG